MVRHILTAAAVLFAAGLAHSETLFEGYYKVVQSGKHVGYYIMKHEYDPKAKQFSSITFMKMKGSKGEDTESVKAIADENFRPVNYSYTAIVEGKTKTIDARFEKGKIIAVVTDNGKVEKINKPIDKNAFLSSFLIYTILRSPQGLKPKSRMDYLAIAEEKAEVAKGMVEVRDFENMEGLKVLRIKNRFLDMESHNIVSERGEVLATMLPAVKVGIELSGQPSLATADFKVPSSILSALFGDVPTGQKNIFAQLRHGKEKASGALGVDEGIPGNTVAPSKPKVGTNKGKSLPPNASKQSGVPGGKGLQLKVNSGMAGETKSEEK